MLPINRPIGTQLGLGVQGVSVYTGADGIPEWKKSVIDDSASINRVLTVVSSDVLVSSAPQQEKHDIIDAEIVDDNYNSDDSGYEFENEDEFEHWKSILISKMEWQDLYPKISNDFRPFKKVVTSHDRTFDTHEASFIKSKGFIPSSLISNLLDTPIPVSDITTKKNSEVNNRILSIDPNVRELLQVGLLQTASDLRNNKDPQQIIAFASGISRSTLNIAALKKTTRNFTVKDKKTIVSAPSWELKDYLDIERIEFNSPIKKILFPHLSSSIYRRMSDLIGIMTENSLHIIKIDNFSSQVSSLKYTQYKPISYSLLGDFPFADFTFNPWDMNEIAIIDIKGNWALFNIPSSIRKGDTIEISNNFRGTIYDPEELSNWKKIQWSSKFTKLVILNRSRLFEVDFQKGMQVELIEAKTWSRLRDYLKLNDDVGILLTTKEIIIIRTNKNQDSFNRVLSWKHDLDPNDNTLKFSVQRILKDKTLNLIVYIYSMRSNNIFVHKFNVDTFDFSVTASGQSIVLTDDSLTNGIQNISFSDESFEEIDYEMLKNYHNYSEDDIWVTLFVKQYGSTEIKKLMVTNVPVSIKTNVKHVHFVEDERNKEQEPISYHLDEVKKIDNIIQQLSVKYISITQKETENVHDVLQDFGYQLSSILNEQLAHLNENDSTIIDRNALKKLIELPTTIESLTEFESFLEQFIEHFQGSSLKFSKLSTIFNLFLHEGISSMDLFYNKLLQCWDIISNNSEFFTKEVVKNLLWASIRFSKDATYDQEYNSTKNDLSPAYSEIMNLWDLDDDELQEEAQKLDSLMDDKSNSQAQFSWYSQSQIPTIKLSQRNKREEKGLSSSMNRISKTTRNKKSSQGKPSNSQASFSSQSSVLPDNMTPAFSLMQSSTTTLSHSQATPASQSSKPKKKKKKKIGGFK